MALGMKELSEKPGQLTDGNKNAGIMQSPRPVNDVRANKISGLKSGMEKSTGFGGKECC